MSWQRRHLDFRVTALSVILISAVMGTTFGLLVQLIWRLL